MSRKSSTYCFCDSARFSGGYLATPCADVIEISLKFEKTHDKDEDANSIHNNSVEKCNLNFLELSHKTLNDVCSNAQVHNCVSGLLQQALIKPSPEAKITSPVDTTPVVMTTVTVHQSEVDKKEKARKDLRTTKRNSSLRSSMKSAHSMETITEKSATRLKDKSPDESKAKSVSHLDNADDEGEEYIENGESIELIFISDEFVNKVQKQNQEMIVLDEKDGKRRDSLTSSNKKIVIITDEYKHKVLRHNSIVVTEKRMSKKSKKGKNYNTNSLITYDEPFDKMESKKIDANVQ